ncbi:MAG: flagellar brake protein [Gammaproteobacteria bacterium]|nr:flagellar brake protein [Gammaproteobacteria bacterium]
MKTVDSSKRITEFILNLMPGKMLDLQFSSPLLVRMKLMLVGYDVGNFLIVKHPSGHDSEYVDVLQAGNVAIVRYIAEGQQGECIAFSAPIRAITSHGSKLIFLEYPKYIENRQLRVSQRQQTHILAEIELLSASGKKAGNAIRGIIVDISSKGCRFSFKTTNTKAQVKKSAIIVSVSIAGHSEDVEINALVRNSRYEHGQIYVGIQFTNQQNEHITQLLSALAIN